MEWMISKAARKKRALRERDSSVRAQSWSDWSGEADKANQSKKSKVSQNDSQAILNKELEHERKVVTEFNQDGGHYHPIKLTKAIEKEIGN